MKTRKECYEYIKANKLSATIKEKTGLNFTNVPTKTLSDYIEKLEKKAKTEESKKKSVVKGTPFGALLILLLEKKVITEAEFKKMMLY